MGVVADRLAHPTIPCRQPGKKYPERDPYTAIFVQADPRYKPRGSVFEKGVFASGRLVTVHGLVVVFRED